MGYRNKELYNPDVQIRSSCMRDTLIRAMVTSHAVTTIKPHLTL